MKTIKIMFTGLTSEIDMENNWITNALKKRYHVVFSNQPDFLFYTPFDPSFRNYDNCVKIWFTGEPITPNFNECDYAMGFDHIQFGDRYIRAAAGDAMGIGLSPTNDYRDFDESIQIRKNITASMTRRKFCNFIYSNSDWGEGAKARVEFCKKLSNYKHVDCPGKVLNNMENAIYPRRITDDCGEVLLPPGDAWVLGKLDFLSNYKFTIAFENVSKEGYVTEKILHPFQAYSVPIYWGNQTVVDEFNPKAFINCNDYDNDFDAVIARIQELDENDDQYLSMLHESPFCKDFDFHRKEKAEAFLYNIIEKGNKPYAKDPMGWQTLSQPDYRGSIYSTYLHMCRNGQVGMHSLLECIRAWAAFKLQKK